MARTSCAGCSRSPMRRIESCSTSFLGTGCRDNEVVHACWQDLDFRAKTCDVREKPDMAFKLRDHEERTVPTPGHLVELLCAHRQRHPDERLVFPADRGGPDNQSPASPEEAGPEIRDQLRSLRQREKPEKLPRTPGVSGMGTASVPEDICHDARRCRGKASSARQVAWDMQASKPRRLPRRGGG